MSMPKNSIVLNKDCSLVASINGQSVTHSLSYTCAKSLRKLVEDYCSDNPKFFKNLPTVSKEVRVYYDVRNKTSLEIRYNKETKQYAFSFSEWKDWKSIRNVGLVTLHEDITLEKEEVLALFKH